MTKATPETATPATPLDKLRLPFPAHQISKLPKPTKAQTDKVKADFKAGIRCTICGAWHHPDVVHLDYVGHAALTDRLLDTDIEWSWEPVAFDERGLPARDQNGGLWIRLTVAGVTRLGYGSADGKQGGDAIKEIIGDALRNAAMRFGAALDLWHKGDLHVDDVEEGETKTTPKPDPTPKPDEPTMSDDVQRDTIVLLAKAVGMSTLSILDTVNAKRAGAKATDLPELTEQEAASIIKKLNLTIEARKAKPAEANADILDDEVRY